MKFAFALEIAGLTSDMTSLRLGEIQYSLASRCYGTAYPGGRFGAHLKRPLAHRSRERSEKSNERPLLVSF